jgi:hypothetical protein
MTREEFSVLFEKALSRATSASSQVSGRVVPSPEAFEVHAPNFAGRVLSAHEALDAVFLSETLFYKVIDVGIIIKGDLQPIGFIRVSGHAPGPYGETINPQDLGPFNVLEPLPSR